MTLVVRDEEDIVEANLRYHLAQGVDFVYAIDHNSVDATPDILRGFEQMGVLRMFREQGDVHDQAARVTRLARLAHDELGADWVINNDADEFWWPALGDLKDVLCAVPDPYGVVIARRHDFIPCPDETGPFHQRMVWRGATSRTPTGGQLGPKAAHRGCPDIVVAPGNHEIYEPVLAVAPPLPLIEVLHFPARSYEQFARKTLNTGRGLELLADRASGTGIDQLELLKLYRSGELRNYFDAWALSEAELRRGVGEGRIVHDARLRDYLRGSDAGTQAHDSGQIREVVRATLQLDVDLATARAEAADSRRESERASSVLAAREAELAELGRESARLGGLAEARAAESARASELAAARAAESARAFELAAARAAEAEQLRHALELVRTSRLMRSTARIRRIYYTLR
jgi:hypothetical protein